MVTAEDVYSPTGVLLLGRNSPITDLLLRRLTDAVARGQAQARFRVLIPPRGDEIDPRGCLA